MAGRINFLEKGKYVITYKKMALMVGVWFVVCFAVFMLETAYKWVLKKEVGIKNQKVALLNKEMQDAMALIEVNKTQFVKPEMKKLSEIYLHFPEWSKVLTEISKNKPAHVWLTEFSSAYGGGGSLLSRRIELVGKGQGTDIISSFVGQMNNDPLFRNVILNKSTKASGDKDFGYSFTLVGDVLFGMKKWD